jgi:hypothetical protein
MVQLGCARRPAQLPERGPLVGAGLTTSTPAALRRRGPRLGRDCEKKRSFPLGPRFLFRDSAANPQVFGYDDGHCALDCSNLAIQTARQWLPPLTAQLLAIRCPRDPDCAHGRNDFARPRQPGVGLVRGSLERPLISAPAAVIGFLA